MSMASVRLSCRPASELLTGRGLLSGISMRGRRSLTTSDVVASPDVHSPAPQAEQPANVAVPSAASMAAWASKTHTSPRVRRVKLLKKTSAIAGVPQPGAARIVKHATWNELITSPEELPDSPRRKAQAKWVEAGGSLDKKIPAHTDNTTPETPHPPAPSEDARLPLSGIRVLDMTRVLAGPYCTQILGDHGAEILKIEHPVRGDDTRAWGPPFAPYTAAAARDGPGEAAYFLSANRNKKSLGLSFQDPRGVTILHALAKSCDVLVENYLPGSLKKYGLDYETLRAVNPALVYVSITGYGQHGPYSKRAGYDVMVEAEFGLMHITGERDGPPVKVGVAITDLTTGLYACNAVMAALLGRAKTGLGQHVDVALSDCQTASLANIAASCLVTGKKDSGRWGTAHPSIVPYRAFKTSDGDILVGGGNDKLWGIMCTRMGKEEWIADERFATNGKRVENRGELEAMIEEVTTQKTTQEWLEVLEGSGMPYAAINDVQTTLQHEHTKARNMVTEVEHPSCGPMKLLNPPVKYSFSKPSVRLPPPTLGQHTDEILTGLLGMQKQEIDRLKADSVIS